MIQTETTPNPDSLKFLSENVISAAGSEEFHNSKKDEITNPFIKELLNFGGVELILLSKILHEGCCISTGNTEIGIPLSLLVMVIV